MAIAKATLVIASVIAAALISTTCPGVEAQAPASSPAAAPAPGLDCLSTLVNMSDCLTYVEAGSNQTKPDPGCCPELAGLVESQPICLCQLLGNPNITGLQIDLSKALKLPSVCGVTTPPVSLCSAAGVPVSVPTASEGPASSSHGSAPPEGLAATPATVNNDNGASATAATELYFLTGLATAFLSTTCF